MFVYQTDEECKIENTIFFSDEQCKNTIEVLKGKYRGKQIVWFQHLEIQANPEKPGHCML